MKVTYDMNQSAARIRQRRNIQGMPQAQLAVKINIGERHLRKIEAGEKGPSIDTLVEMVVKNKLCKLLYRICDRKQLTTAS